jgi:hypothetical protein
MSLKDITRQLSKLGRRMAGQEQTDKTQLGPDDPMVQSYERQFDRQVPARLRAAAQRAEHADMVRAAPVSEQNRRTAQAWLDAIAALPGSLRTEAHARFTALADAEQQLTDKRQRLAALPSDGDEIWIQRRAALTTAIEALEDLVTERTAACQQICRYSVPGLLDQVLRAMEAAKAQELADAELEQAALLERSRAEIGRLKAERAAIGTVRAQMNDPRLVEQHIGGRALSPDPRKIEQTARERERESHLQIARVLKAARSL